MSDHEDSKPAQAHDVDDAVAAAPEADAQGAAETADTAQGADAPAVEESSASHDAVEEPAPAAQPDHAAVAQSANESLAEAERAAADATAPAQEHAEEQKPVTEKPAAEKPAVDPDLAAFEEAEAVYPGTFGGTFTPPAARPAEAVEETVAIDAATTRLDAADDARTQVLAPPPAAVATPAPDAPPIFVQAPEAPRERGNRGAIFGIGLLAAIAFAILYLGTALGIAAIEGNIATSDSFVPVLLDHLRSAGLWVPVAAFAIGFWLLGGIINRGRWGFWVVFGIVVGAFAYGGHVLGAIGSVEFWKLGGSEIAGLANAQLLAPLAIAAFIFGRELTIWFGAWAARTGARRTAQNEEAQREYERVLEAGPQLP